MVDVMGHFGMALVWAIPAWFVWDGRVSLLFIGLALGTAMLPDVDLVLSMFLPIQHHGVTHTIVFVVAISLIAGAIVEVALRSWLERVWLQGEGHTLTRGTLFVFVAGAFLLGGLSHLFADMLSAPDISTPIEPFWPFFDKPFSVDLIWYNDPLWNVGLLTVAILLHAVLAYVDIGIDHRYRVRRQQS